MKNKITIFIMLILVVIMLIVIVSNISNKIIESPMVNVNQDNIMKEINEKEKEKMRTNIKITINNENYNLILEQNETVQEFMNMLPREFSMTELNGNEKYVYLDNTLPTNPYNPKHIEAGDVMLYGNNCLVIFYKAFDTSYSYTKIGSIENLPDLGSENITIKFEN